MPDPMMNYRLSDRVMPASFEPLLSGGEMASGAASAPSLVSSLSPWLSVAAGGAGVASLGLDAFMKYQDIEDRKKRERQLQRNWEREMAFKQRAYDEAAPQRATDLSGSNYSVAEKAQDWRDRIAQLTRGR